VKGGENDARRGRQVDGETDGGMDVGLLCVCMGRLGSGVRMGAWLVWCGAVRQLGSNCVAWVLDPKLWREVDGCRLHVALRFLVDGAR
jgi:hypothetical protein